MDYQLIVIGAGPGGYTAALRAAALGLHTAVVECREVGGTCLNRGCIPTKTLLHASQVYRDAVDGASMGVHAANATFDMGEIFAYKRGVSEKLRNGIHGLLKSAKVDLIEGVGRIAATSDELLEGCDRLYDSLVIIGGGVIGVEFATFYRNLGCAVTLVEGMDRLLPNMDRELGQNLQQIMKKQGVEVLTNAVVQSLEQTESGLAVHVLQKGAEKTVTGEKVLCAIGRRAYWDGVFAEGMNPETRGKSLKVDENFQTSIPGVYAIGDASSVVQLAHVAAAQGTACVERMYGVADHVDLNVIPSCIYSTPEIAVVGITEAEAKERGIPAVVGKCTMFGNARTVIEDPGRCFMKIVAHAETHEILGASLMCQHASDMISQISAAMVNHQTAEELRRVMRPHPSFEEAMTEALDALASKLA